MKFILIREATHSLSYIRRYRDSGTPHLTRQSKKFFSGEILSQRVYILNVLSTVLIDNKPAIRKYFFSQCHITLYFILDFPAGYSTERKPTAMTVRNINTTSP